MINKKAEIFFDQWSLANFHEIFARLVLKQTPNLYKSQLGILDNECLFDSVISIGYKY